jgi:hypothetical protein
VCNTRKKFEEGRCSHGNIMELGGVMHGAVGAGRGEGGNVRSLAQNLMSNLGKSRMQGKTLAGAVALPGMPTFFGAATSSVAPDKTTTSSVCRNVSNDALSSLLGISNDDNDDDSNVSIEGSGKERVCNETESVAGMSLV